MRVAPSTYLRRLCLMLDFTWTLGCISAAMLAIAGVVWATQLRGPWLQRLDGVQATNARATDLCTCLCVERGSRHSSNCAAHLLLKPPLSGLELSKDNRANHPFACRVLEPLDQDRFLKLERAIEVSLDHKRGMTATSSGQRTYFVRRAREASKGRSASPGGGGDLRSQVAS